MRRDTFCLRSVDNDLSSASKKDKGSVFTATRSHVCMVEVSTTHSITTKHTILSLRTNIKTLLIFQSIKVCTLGNGKVNP